MILLSYASKDVGAKNGWSHVALIDSFDREEDAFAAMIRPNKEVMSFLKAKPFLFIIATEDFEYGHVIGFSMLYKRKLMSVTRKEIFGGGKKIEEIETSPLNLRKELVEIINGFTHTSDIYWIALAIGSLDETLLNKIAIDLIELTPEAKQSPIYQDAIEYLLGNLNHDEKVRRLNKFNLNEQTRIPCYFSFTISPKSSAVFDKSVYFQQFLQEIINYFADKIVPQNVRFRKQEIERVSSLQIDIIRRTATLAEFILPRML